MRIYLLSIMLLCTSSIAYNDKSRCAKVSIVMYLSDNVFAVRNRHHPRDELQQHDTEAVNVGLVGELLRHEVFWIQVALHKFTQGTFVWVHVGLPGTRCERNDMSFMTLNVVLTMIVSQTTMRISEEFRSRLLEFPWRWWRHVQLWRHSGQVWVQVSRARSQPPSHCTAHQGGYYWPWCPDGILGDLLQCGGIVCHEQSPERCAFASWSPWFPLL